MYLICPSLSVLRGVKYVRPKKKKSQCICIFNCFAKSLIVPIKNILIKWKNLCKTIYSLDSRHQNFDSICSVNSFFYSFLSDLLIPQKLRCCQF